MPTATCATRPSWVPDFPDFPKAQGKAWCVRVPLLGEPGAGPPEKSPLTGTSGHNHGPSAPRWGRPCVRTTATLGGPKMSHTEVGSIQYPRPHALGPPAPHSTPAPSTAGHSFVWCAQAAPADRWRRGRGPWISVSVLLPFSTLQWAGRRGRGQRVAGKVGRGLGTPRFPGLPPTSVGCQPPPRRRAGATRGGGGALGRRGAGCGGGAASSSAAVSPAGGGGQGAAAGVRLGGGGARRGHIWPFRRRRSPARRPGSRSPGSPVPARRRP